MRLTIGCLVAVFEPSGQLLVVQQRWPSDGRWGLPGGSARRHERPEATAARELEEETGVVVAITPEDEVAHYKQPNAPRIDIVYSITLAERPELRVRDWREIKGASWIDTPSDLLESVLNDAAIDALGMVLDRPGPKDREFLYLWLRGGRGSPSS
jgi:ADP-ribose pyrophosphatase YjhB (NUDIX family)